MQKFLNFYSFEYDANGMACKTFSSFMYGMVSPNMADLCPHCNGRVLCHQATNWQEQGQSHAHVSELGCWFEDDVDNLLAKRSVRNVATGNAGCWVDAPQSEFDAAPHFSSWDDASLGFRRCKDDPDSMTSAEQGMQRGCHFSKTKKVLATGVKMKMMEQTCTHVLDDEQKCLGTDKPFCRIVDWSCNSFIQASTQVMNAADYTLHSYRQAAQVNWRYLFQSKFSEKQQLQSVSSPLKDAWWVYTLCAHVLFNYLITQHRKQNEVPSRCWTFGGMGYCGGNWESCGLELALFVNPPLEGEERYQVGDYCIELDQNSFIEVSDMGSNSNGNLNSVHDFHHPKGMWYAMALCWHKLFIPTMSPDEYLGKKLGQERGGVALYELRSLHTNINAIVIKIYWIFFGILGVDVMELY